MDTLLTNLEQIAAQQNLISNAIAGAKLWVSSEDFGIDNSITDKFKFEFHSHKLCFKHEYIEVSYIETNLTILLEEEEVGYYSWHTLLDGEVIDDMLVITDNELKYS
ncbi:hypothetical protein DS891_04110 [Pseudoalteromonas sp. JC28]|uniref:hypothetical protein n=1 Tax=Pseudoalteromonas sp. JC28 TaxID=2267617 RepID=UPI001573D7A1|nr:hypothetical protein [Pseudoalteromonas sp. JC28]NSY32785.1 hypothetical protein [Pseudoalteromonas sp. JC28]